MTQKILLLFITIILLSCSKKEEIATTEPNTIEKGKITASLNVNGTQRDYIIYIPKNYTGNKAYPVLFAFHGLGGNMESSYKNSKFYELAETENFIAVHPNGISAKWDAVKPNNNVDVTFVKQLIESLESNYNIDSKRIYSSGMSNGGYFSFLLACELSDKIAAIGSVTGLMFKNVLDNCKPTKPVPVLQIHGTEDGIVDYYGVNAVITFWTKHNNTNSTANTVAIPNTNTTDGSTVERFSYVNGDNNVEVQHLKITGGGHQWPGHEGNMDINASEEVWNFVKKFDINGKIK